MYQAQIYVHILMDNALANSVKAKSFDHWQLPVNMADEDIYF